MTDKTFQELHADYLTAIGRGNLIQALDIAGDLFLLLAPASGEFNIATDDTTFVTTGYITTANKPVFWHEIVGKPDLCNPSECPCKTGVFNGDFNVTGNLTTGGNWTANNLAAANPVDTSGWQVVKVGGQETPFKIKDGVVWVDDVAVKAEETPLTPEETKDLTEKFHGADIRKFDHDGDGRPGGSRKGSRKKKTD